MSNKLLGRRMLLVEAFTVSPDLADKISGDIALDDIPFDVVDDATLAQLAKKFKGDGGGLAAEIQVRHAAYEFAVAEIARRGAP